MGQQIKTNFQVLAIKLIEEYAEAYLEAKGNKTHARVVDTGRELTDFLNMVNYALQTESDLHRTKSTPEEWDNIKREGNHIIDLLHKRIVSE